MPAPSDLKWLVSVAVTAGIAGFFGYLGWDCGRSVMVWLLTNFGR